MFLLKKFSCISPVFIYEVALRSSIPLCPKRAKTRHISPSVFVDLFVFLLWCLNFFFHDNCLSISFSQDSSCILFCLVFTGMVSPALLVIRIFPGSTVQKRHRWQLKIEFAKLLMACTMYINAVQKLRGYGRYGPNNCHKACGALNSTNINALMQKRNRCGNAICKVWFCTISVLVAFFEWFDENRRCGVPKKTKSNVTGE